MGLLSTSSQQGFTFVEILVVMTIVAVLAALLLPQIPRLQEMGNATKCMNNLRTIGLAIHQFAGENNDRLPGPAYEIIFIKGNNLCDGLAPYLGAASKTVWQCPSHPSMDPQYSTYKTRYPFFGYHYNPPKMSIDPPTRQFLMANYPPEYRWLLEDIDDWNYGVDARLGKINGPVHAGFRNALFLDGHVERIHPTKGQLSSLP